MVTPDPEPKKGEKGGKKVEPNIQRREHIIFRKDLSQKGFKFKFKPLII